MNKKTILFSAILGLMLFTMSSFAQQNDTMDSGNKTMKSEDKMKTSNKMNDDSAFMKEAAVSGMNEMGLSRTALDKSSSDQVKQYALKMIDDHTVAGDQLKTLAASKNVVLPAEMDAKHKAANEKLSAMSGDAFDREYVKLMVQDHKKAVAAFKKEINRGRDADVKAFAAKTLPTLQNHLDLAINMENTKSSDRMNSSKMSDKKMSNDRMNPKSMSTEKMDNSKKSNDRINDNKTTNDQMNDNKTSNDQTTDSNTTSKP